MQNSSVSVGSGAGGIYTPSLATLTDLYQLTMAYAYFKTGHTDKQAVFHMFFRRNPFGGGFAVAAGLKSLIDLIENYRFDKEDLEYLSLLTGADGQPLFDRSFIDFLGTFKLNVDIDAVAEGEVVFAHEPLVRVQGSLIECQLLETAILNFFNFQTLVATKAARIKLAAQGKPVLEFGLRRAQGPDGGLTASRSAYIGGADATSNVLAGRLYGIPVKGTHAHSWVMSYEDELDAFRDYARVMPNNCIFLVDTYDSLNGVKHAITIGHELKAKGYELGGIRLDSGDLAYLSIEARKLLDQAGFLNCEIVASNDLDEKVIASLVEQGACIDVWGVGTKLVTAEDQPALGGVYKLSCVRNAGAESWQPRLKLSEQSIKISTPGIHQVRRFYLQETGRSQVEGSERRYLADMIFDIGLEGPDSCGGARIIVDPVDAMRRKSVPEQAEFEDLLQPIYRSGKLIYQVPALEQSKALKEKRIGGFHPTILRLLNPHQYPVGLESRLHKMKMDLVLQARGFESH